MSEKAPQKDPESWEDLHQVASAVLVPGVTEEEIARLYNRWANNGYDETLQDLVDRQEYGAVWVMQQEMQDLFPENKRGAAIVLDVGAGTGISGEILRKVGFKILDGLDPAAEMLRIAQKKQTYRNTYTCYLSDQPTEIPAGTYDAVVMAGVVGHGCLPCAAFQEIARIVKPGGYIVNCMRKAYLQEVEDYREHWEPMVRRLEEAGKWKLVKADPYPNHFMGNEGLKVVFHVLS